MKSESTNTTKLCLVGPIPQADLHVKVLDLIAKRFKPEREDLCFEKGVCKACVNSVNTPPKTDKTQGKKNNKNFAKKDKLAGKKVDFDFNTFNNAEIKNMYVEDRKDSKPIIRQSYDGMGDDAIRCYE